MPTTNALQKARITLATLFIVATIQKRITAKRLDIPEFSWPLAALGVLYVFAVIHSVITFLIPLYF